MVTVKFTAMKDHEFGAFIKIAIDGLKDETTDPQKVLELEKKLQEHAHLFLNKEARRMNGTITCHVLNADNARACLGIIKNCGIPIKNEARVRFALQDTVANLIKMSASRAA